MYPMRKRTFLFGAASGALTLVSGVGSGAAWANTAAHDIATALASDRSLSDAAKAFYQNRNFAPVFTGKSNQRRADALIDAVAAADSHGLPAERYQAAALQDAIRAARRGQNIGPAEVFAAAIFVRYAHDLQSGMLVPSRVDKNIAVRNPRRADDALLAAASKSTGAGFFAALAPNTPEYKALMRQKADLERLLGRGGFGDKVPGGTMKPGRSYNAVPALRARLARKGYGRAGTDTAYDEDLVQTVAAFQQDHGLTPDGVVGPGTLREINATAEQRLSQVIVNLERERWMNFRRGKRHIVVNIPAYGFKLYDNNRMSFQSDTVVGAVKSDRVTPEFHDEMTHMVINPTWHVPRSIAGKEYLPMLQRDATSLSRQGLRVISRSGKTVDPTQVDWSQMNAQNFPFSIKQPPSRGNALGIVKFMFPNKFNIYLHDTPSKNLFKREARAFSHGCIRVARPVEFAHKLLERQTAKPEEAFEAWLGTRREQYVNLAEPVPVYLNYRTAFFDEGNRVQYRRDLYGRDQRLFRAMQKAGVKLRAVS